MWDSFTTDDEVNTPLQVRGKNVKKSVKRKLKEYKELEKTENAKGFAWAQTKQKHLKKTVKPGGSITVGEMVNILTEGEPLSARATFTEETVSWAEEFDDKMGDILMEAETGPILRKERLGKVIRRLESRANIDRSFNSDQFNPQNQENAVVGIDQITHFF